MSAPVLWGIDPEQVYRWTPSEFRQLPAGWEAREAAIRPTEEGLKDPAIVAKYESDLRDLVREFMAVPRAPKPGSPILILAPMLESVAFRLQSARTLYERNLFWARENLAADVKTVKDGPGSDQEKADKIRDLERKATEENVRRGIESYSEDLRAEVLRASVKGWENFRIPFGSNWIRAFAKNPEWLNELFMDIVSGAAFSEIEEEGFTLPRESA